jgi:cobalt-zinc-cadmium efflux system protein
MHSHVNGKKERLAHRTLVIAILITLAFAIVEGVGGKVSGSLTLLSDAGHMLFDAIALGISALGAWLAIKPPSLKNTYGPGRAEVLAAWISSFLMILLSFAIIVNAMHRFQHPTHVAGITVTAIALIGLLANLFIAYLFRHTEKTLNIKAALLHVVGDILGSIAALLSGVIIYLTHWLPIDPILSIFISILILFSSIRLLWRSMHVLMETVPGHLNLAILIEDIQQNDNIQLVHDIHVWTLTSGQVLLSAHITVKTLCHWADTLQQTAKMLQTKYNISHITLQPELNVPKNNHNHICEQG